jgi:hypothetical protein
LKLRLKCLSLLSGLPALAAGGGSLSGVGVLVDERLVDVGDDTAAGDGRLDQGVELLVTADSQKQMAGGDALDLEVLAGVTGKLEHLSSQVLHDSGGVDSGSSTDTLVVMNSLLEESVDTTHRELKSGSGRTRLRGSLGGGGFATLASLATFTTFTFATAKIHCRLVVC